MKACSYCGSQLTADATRCPECGNPGDATPGPALDPHASIRSVLVHTYSTEMAANIAVSVLDSAGIPSLVMVDDCGGMLQPISAAKGFRVMVGEPDLAGAKSALGELDLQTRTLAAANDAAGNGPTAPRGLTASTRLLLLFALGIAVGWAARYAYERQQQHFTGTTEEDRDHDRSADEWWRYIDGKLVEWSLDRNSDGRKDGWVYYGKDGLVEREESDDNFDGKPDAWAQDLQGVRISSQEDTDFNGKPDVTYSFKFGLPSEAIWTWQDSGVLWKKELFEHGSLRSELVDTNRDGVFDEKITYDAFGRPTKTEKPN